MASSGSGDALRLELDDRWQPRTDPEFVAEVVRATLDFADQRQREVSLRLTGDVEIAQVHGEFLDDPTPTDVISFDLDESIEVIVSVECAHARADELGHDRSSEVALYIAHGILHGCGFDDIDADDRVQMRGAERAVLNAIGRTVTAVDHDDATCDAHDATRLRAKKT